MIFRRNRAPKFPKELLDEARRYPGGHVYEIEGPFDRDGAIPPYAIRRGWEIGPDGQPTGDFTDNPNFGVRQPMGDMEQLMADARAQSTGDEIELLVRNELSQRDTPLPFDVGITIVADFVMGLGFFPPETDWMTERADGRRYRFVRSGV